jgi:hypothetical protein
MSYNFVIPVIDTDSLTISKPDGSEFSQEEINKLTKEINDLTDELIRWEFEFYIPKIIVVKSKNYVLDYGGGKVKTKGSSIRDQKKEPAMREMMDKMIQAMLDDKQDTLVDIYHSYIKEAINVKDIKRWCFKKTVTAAVLDCAKPSPENRKNEMVVWEAIKNESAQMGDKVYVYPVILGYNTESGRIGKKGKPLKDKITEITGLKLEKYWTNDHDCDKLIERCYATVSIFETVLDMSKFIDYSKAKNKKLLETL